MYMEDMCTIKKTDDGKFVVQMMPMKKKEMKPAKEGMTMPMEEPKTYVAEDADELAEMIREHANMGKKKTPAEKFEKGYAKG